jgi:hypothetical protein
MRKREESLNEIDVRHKQAEGNRLGLHRLLAEPDMDQETVFLNDNFRDFRLVNLMSIRKGDAQAFEEKRRRLLDG